MTHTPQPDVFAVDADTARAVFDATPDALVMVDDRGFVEMVNTQACVLFGFESADDIVGSALECLLPDRYAQTHAAHRNRYLADPEVRTMGLGLELLAKRTDGTEIPVEISLSPLTVGGRLRVIAAIRDITERTRTRATIEALSEVQSSLLAESPVAETLALLCRHARNLVRADSTVFARPVAEKHTDEPTHLHAVVIDSAVSSESPQKSLVIDDVIRPVLAGEQVRLTRGGVETLIVPVDSLSGVDGVLIVNWQAAASQLSAQDFDTMARFSQAAATALQLDEARRGHQRTELLEDRERIGRDMHDLVIGRLFATGMSLQSMTARISDPAAQDRLAAAVTEIDETIKEIRSSIYGIRSQEGWAKGVRGEILALAADMQKRLGFEPRVRLVGPIDDLPAPVVVQLLAALRESLTNSAKYADASSIDVSVRVSADQVKAVVHDDGKGFDLDALEATLDGSHHGKGLTNIVSRAANLGGSADVASRLDHGTTITWAVPLSPQAADAG